MGIYGGTDYSFSRWGTLTEPYWVHGATFIAPPANTNLVSKTVSAGKTGRVFGVIIAAGEINDFVYAVTIGGATTIGLIAGQVSTFVIVLPSAFISGIPAGTIITVRNVTAGGIGINYRADILYDES